MTSINISLPELSRSICHAT